MEPVKNLLTLLWIVNIFNTIVNGELSCEDEAHKLIQFKSTHTFYIDDCKFVNVRFEEHVIRNLMVSIVYKEDVLETLNLTETDGLLADFSTPVYTLFNKTDKNCEAFEFRQSIISQLAPDLGYFTLYRDQTKMAALVYTYRKPTDFSLEGNIGHYVLRHLPSSENKSRYIFIKLLDAYQAFPNADHEAGVQQKFDLEAPHVDTIIIELIVVIDFQKSDTTSTEKMKRVLMYYNYIDMLYCDFRRPLIRFAIKGICVLETPIGDTHPDSEYLTLSSIISLKNLIEREKDRLRLSNYHIISVMTQRLILLNNNPMQVSQAEMIDERKICDSSHKPLMIVALTTSDQAGHGIIMSILFWLLSTVHLRRDMNKNCHNFTVNIQPDNLNLMTLWPTCVTREYSNYFKTNFCAHYAKN